MRRVRLLVCGEPMRGDDAVALVVLDALPEATRRMTDVGMVSQLMPDDLVDGDGPVLILDAVEGPDPGTVVDIPLSALAAAHDRGLAPASSHALPLPITLGVVEQLRGALPDGRLLGIAGDDYAIGAALSPAVAESVAACATRVNHWVRVLAHERRARTCA